MKGILAMFLAALGLTSCASGTSFRSVGVDEFKEVIELPGTQIVDVRTPEEFADGHIEGSVNIDVNGDAFRNVVQEKLDKKKTVAVYCRSGRRSKNAAAMLHEMGYKVVELDGGYNSWK